MLKTYYEQELDRISSQIALPDYLYVQLRQSRAFMEQYHTRSIALHKIASSAFMSRFHYVRLFHKVYGQTPRQYLRDLRISRAKDLLREGFDVTRVCFDVGYASLPTFSSTFKRGTGYSPQAFQRLNKSNPE